MTVLSMAEAEQDAQGVGFNGMAAKIIAAIAMAESSLNSSAQHVNADGSVDRGILQINSYWHSEIPDSCAYDPVCSFKQAYRISNGGTSFTQWATYTGGQYQRYMSAGPSNRVLYTANTASSSNDIGTTLAIWGESVAVFVLGAILVFLGFYVMLPKGKKGIA